MTAVLEGSGRTYLEFKKDTMTPYASFAPGNEDGMNALVKFVADGRTRPVNTDSQIARSLFVKAEDPSFVRTMAVQILGLTRHDLSYINEMLLPTQLTRDTKFKWSKIQYIPGAMTRNPALGVNYTHERITNEFESQAGRVGQHFEMEADAFDTEDGQLNFQRNMMYWAVTMADTLAMTAWAEIVRPRPELRLRNFDNIRDRDQYFAAVVRERDLAFTPYKSTKGMYQYVQLMCERILGNSTHEPNLMVMPRDKGALVMNGTDINEYRIGGQKGVDMLMGKGYLTEMAGVKVFSSPSFVTNPQWRAQSPLDDEVRVGSYHILKYAAAGDPSGFVPGRCLDKLYDVHKDRWVEPPHLLDMLLLSGRFVKQEVPDTDPVTGNPVMTLMWVAVPPTDAYARKDTDDPFVELCYNAETKEFEHKAFKYDKDVIAWVLQNCDVVTVAPFDGCATQGTLVAAAAPEAGITTLSEPRITKGEDAATQKLIFNMTCWMGAHVFDPSRFLVTHNVFYNGLLGGGAVSFINPTEAGNLIMNDFVDSRLNRPSMYVMLVAKNGAYETDFIDLRGPTKFDIGSNTSTYPCSAFYSNLYGWDQIDDEVDEYARKPIAHLCFRAPYNRLHGTNYKYEPGHTHHGKQVGVGSREQRRYGRAIADLTLEATMD